MVFLLSNPLKLLCFCLIASTMQAQSSEWSTYYEDNELKIEISSVACHLPTRGTHQQVLYLRYENKTNSIIDVNVNRKVWYDNQCIGCNGQAENRFSLTIPAQGSISGACIDGPKDKRLSIFQYSLDGVTNRSLTNFELSDIQVTVH